jgi:hypothetical protein
MRSKYSRYYRLCDMLKMLLSESLYAVVISSKAFPPTWSKD